MTSPSLELQGVVVARLKAYPGLTDLIDGRVFDRVRADAAYPYVSWGPEQAISGDADGITGFDITIQIDAWSQKVGLPEVKRVAEQVRLALTEQELELKDNALVLLEHRQTRILPEPDGLTSHAAIEFAAFIEQP
ncbi:DUF3168 domain-containing protein [Bradyrhizobium barranii subsp. barranii]|uniref:DUF3168 domain-containing protein n=1 Tax=Bradyrhizobium barranii subsp. barranii TaxID=2823807 RepID=A0A939M972_9BRAD|nr:DUF3168 domain-containing protein [Bradyrhizobium barranii]UEM09016.1 DUF3168 domain-containing protein [Bradyrhizobium barranii subsp. barranii]